MTTALTTTNGAPSIPAVTNEHIELVRRTVAKDANAAELELYLYDCQRHGVHPLDKLLHFTKRQGKYTPITSIDLLRTRAADTNEFAGDDDPRYTGNPGDNDFAAHVTVYRMVQGQRCGFSATARWIEYYPGEQLGFMWRKMPYLMLGKCAEALALRKAFPRQLSGLYVREEMDQAGPDETRRVNVATGEIADTPPRALPQPSNDTSNGEPTCDVCGARGRKSKRGDGYYCPNKDAHDGKWHTIKETPVQLPPADDYSEEWNDIDQAAEERRQRMAVAGK